MVIKKIVMLTTSVNGGGDPTECLTSILSSIAGLALPVLIELKFDLTVSTVFSILSFYSKIQGL